MPNEGGEERLTRGTPVPPLPEVPVDVLCLVALRQRRVTPLPLFSNLGCSCVGITELTSGRASPPLVVKVGTAPHLLVAARPPVVLKLAPLLPGLAAADGPPSATKIPRLQSHLPPLRIHPFCGLERPPCSFCGFLSPPC